MELVKLVQLMKDHKANSENFVGQTNAAQITSFYLTAAA